MTTAETYNGYTNYETWLVSLWIDNDQGEQEFWLEQANELEQYDLSEAPKEHYEENSPLAEDANMYVDLLNRALARVNWYEIAENLKQDAKELAE